MNISYEKELRFVEETALAAGERIKELFEAQDGWVKEKSPNNPLTQADLDAEGIIRTAISRRFPEDGWVSEETPLESHDVDKKRVWIVDPLDGTIEFTQKIPEFAVSIGLTDGGRPALGVIYNPVTGELFSGARGEGVFLNGQERELAGPTALQEARILCSGTEFKKGQVDFLKDRVRLCPKGGTAYKLALVASGKYDGYISVKPKNSWDYAAGIALAKAAGSVTADLDGNGLEILPRKVNGFCIGQAPWQGELLSVLQDNLRA
jgi:myo-inositol-1(or 4)-monophosphatase